MDMNLIGGFAELYLFASESGFDRNQIVIYDLTTEIKFKLTPTWDRSPESLSVC